MFEFSTYHDEEYNKNYLDDENFDKEFIEWYDSGKPESNIKEISDYRSINQFILREIAYDGCNPVDKIEDEPRRWNIWTDYIFKFNDRYFKIGCDEPLTEMQETGYGKDEDIIEVEKRTVVKVVNEWVAKK